MTTITRTNSIQATFNPADYGFKWVGDWYEFDSIMGKRMALKARNAEVKRLRAEGWQVNTFCLGGQLISRGGIGSGQPHIEVVVSVYGLNAWR